MWSMGVLLYYLVEGDYPFRDTSKKSISRAPAFKSRVWSVHVDMKRFCLALLQPNYNIRIATAMEALIHPWFCFFKK